MKRIILLLFLIFINIFVSSCLNNNSFPKDLFSCNYDQDCIIVKGRGCCGCETGINKQYESWWNTRSAENVDECRRECEICPPIPTGVTCIENKCRPTLE